MEHFGNEFTTIFYIIDAANSGKSMVSAFSEDTEVFVLLVCWVYREETECKVQMERWDMTVQLRQDLVSTGESQDQCAIHLAH